jgi:hypothetical protein
MYLQDTHVENFASRKKSTAVMVLRVILLLAGIVCVVPLGLYLWPLLIALALFFLAWFAGTRDQIDFDYSYTNGTIDIARVFSKSSRKRYLSFEMSDVIICAPKDSNAIKGYTGRGLKVWDCTSRDPEKKVYAVVFRNQKKDEEIVLMELEDDFLDAMEHASKDVVHR